MICIAVVVSSGMHKVCGVKAGEVKGMRKAAAPNMAFDSNQSSKRKVPRGSDPIHNRS